MGKCFTPVIFTITEIHQSGAGLMAGLDDPGGLLNFDSVNPNSVSFATVRQALTSQPLSLLECCFQSQQRRWLNGAVSCGISEGGLEQVSGCEANSQGLCCS